MNHEIQESATKALAGVNAHISKKAERKITICKNLVTADLRKLAWDLDERYPDVVRALYVAADEIDRLRGVGLAP